MLVNNQPWVSICIYDIYTFLYISYIQKSVYIFCYIYGYIYSIYTLYMKFRNGLYICIYTVYMKLRDFVYIHVYIQHWALQNWHVPILLGYDSSNQYWLSICIYDIYNFCIYNVYIYTVYEIKKMYVYAVYEISKISVYIRRTRSTSRLTWINFFIIIFLF